METIPNNERFFMLVSSNFNDNVYVSQDWWSDSKLKNAKDFLELAFTFGALNEKVFTIESQFQIHNQSPYSYEEYAVPTVSCFSRTNSRGVEVTCFALRDGHHRYWVSRRMGVRLEVVIDKVLGSVGPVTSIQEMNKNLFELSGGNLGRLEKKILMSRTIENRIGEKVNYGTSSI